MRHTPAEQLMANMWLSDAQIILDHCFTITKASFRWFFWLWWTPIISLCGQILVDTGPCLTLRYTTSPN
ncbi:hypothetical protein DPMN_170936 [Dreissena polymorpha]|uniref:Uncharacterized protein n=1 Tax=Dreissena polymorpha TaxID=45954 RepID=A0A9D4DX40_DREPO|nr:hypothetical protein DPMN_170936 [Dreissena polymorpha]